MDEFYKLINEYNYARTSFREKAISLIKEEIKDIFEKTRIKAIYWVQYTPYFNDGDECVFGIREILVSTNPDSDFSSYEESEEVYDGFYLNSKVFLSYEIEMVDNLVKILQEEDIQEVLKFAFGDHVSVIATKEGISIEDYCHD